MRYRMMATYRGVPYEAGVGPSGSDVVLFAACPPPEELGFEPAPGHWRKRVIRAEVDALWESRPVGSFRGEPCMVLDDLGDRLHIAYLGRDPEAATRLGYWQVDRGVFELLTPREDVTALTEERVDKPLSAAPQRGGADSGPGYPYGEPGQAGYPDPLAPPPGVSTATGPLSGGPLAGALPASGRPDPLSGPLPGALPGSPLPGSPLPGSPLAAAPFPGSLADSGPLPPVPPLDGYPGTAFPLPATTSPGMPAVTSPGLTTTSPGIPAVTSPGIPVTVPPGLRGTASPVTPTAAPPGLPPVTSPGLPPVTSPGLPAVGSMPTAPPAPGASPAPAAGSPPAAPRPAPASAAGKRKRAGGGRAARRQRVRTREIFCELADLAAIPRAEYALEAEVDGALCLLQTAEGFEVFVSVDGARHEARSFADEEAAYFYLFGVLAADAIRNGLLVPASSPATARAGLL